jgi:hypothetical protein
MTQTIVHFVFTPSGAGCLVQALRKAGRDDQVVTAFDDLSFGPINPFNASARVKWVETELGRSDWSDTAAESERAWDGARFPDNRKVAWLSRRSAMEYAGFLEWLWRMGDAPCESARRSHPVSSFDDDAAVGSAPEGDLSARLYPPIVADPLRDRYSAVARHLRWHPRPPKSCPRDDPAIK